MINQGDFLRALADKEMRENSRNQARRNLTISLNRLRTLTGRNDITGVEEINFEIYEELIQYLANISDEDESFLFNTFWNVIVGSNPALAKAGLRTERAEKSLTHTRREYAPTIRATVFSSDFRFLPWYNSTGNSGISITGSIPLDFWVMNNRIERSRLSRDSAYLDFESTEISLEQELQNVLFNLFSQAGLVLSLRRSLEHTERHFEFVMQRYRLLQSSVSELNDASTLYINSRNNLNRANFNFLQSLSRLRSLCALDDKDQLFELLLSYAQLVIPSP
jgi:outer membrane protein TolC